MERYLLGIDNGGTAVKCALFTLDGRQIGSGSTSTPLVTPCVGFEERDMEVLWQKNAAVIRECLEKTGVDPAAVVGVGVVGHGKGLYAVDAAGKPVRNAIASTDSRAEAYIERWESDGTAEAVSRLTLHHPVACQQVALLAWLKDNEPEKYARIATVFACKDYIRYRLTGKALAEMTDYSGSGMMNLHTSAFDPEIFRLLGIAEMADKLPPLCVSYQNCGTVTAEAAAATGLKEGTPVSGGMFDIDGCAIAGGVSEGKPLCMVTGTWSINEYVADAPVVSKTSKNSLFCLPGKYLIEESSATSAGNLEWVLSMCMEKEKEAAGKGIYALVDQMVDALPPEESEVVFVPFLYGTNSAVQKHAAFDGLDQAHGKADLLRAVYEGVVYSHYTHLLRLLALREMPSEIRLVGGAARSRVWSQMFADVTGLPVRTVAATEPGALGAAMSAAVAAGIFPDYEAAAAGMVSMKELYLPDARRHAVYAEKYERYRRLTE